MPSDPGPNPAPDHGLGQIVTEYLRSILPVDQLRMAMGEDDKAAWRARYWDDPVAFCRDHFRWPKSRDGQIRWLTDYQQDCMRRLMRHKRLAVYGPRGLGKTRLAAAIVWFFYFTRDGEVDWKIPVTAGGYRQLEQYLFPEIHSLARLIRWDKVGRKPLSRRDELMKLTIEGETGRAFGAASTDPALIEGAHAPQLLYVIDESKAVADGVYDAIEGMLVASGLDDREAYILSISTPGAKIGRFFQICSKAEGYADWDVRHVSAEEAIRAGRMNPEWARQRARQWGTTSALYKCHVLGEFADTSDDGVIPHFWIEDAMERPPGDAMGPADAIGRTVLAVDVASGGHAETVIAIRRGWACLGLIAFQNNDTMEVVNRVCEVHSQVRAEAIVIDVVGVGAGVFDRLREMGLPVVPFHGGEAATERDLSGEISFLNRRAQAWWTMRELLHPYSETKVSLPKDQLLLTQLAAPTYAKTQHDHLKVESKTDIEKRLRKLNPNTTDSCSPDRADAVVMAFSDAVSSHYEEAYARGGLHTGKSLDMAALQQPTRDEVNEELKRREEARREAAEERLRRARPEAAQIESMLWGGVRKNFDIFGDW